MKVWVLPVAIDAEAGVMAILLRVAEEGGVAPPPPPHPTSIEAIKTSEP
jgi:hypothetical protein